MGFLSDLTLGRYYATGSHVHERDPRVKMVGTLAILVAALMTENLAAYAFLTAALLVVIFFARLRPSFLLRNLGSLKWLLLVVFFMHALFTKGTPVFKGFERFTFEGALVGVVFMWRIAIMVTTATRVNSS